jgi:hypothetical protein
MKDELKQSAVRHSDRVISKITEVMQIPEIVSDSIRREMEYATMDGYRITMRNLNRNGEYKDERIHEAGA